MERCQIGAVPATDVEDRLGTAEIGEIDGPVVEAELRLLIGVYRLASGEVRWRGVLDIPKVRRIRPLTAAQRS
jgi:hypothetical protein